VCAALRLRSELPLVLRLLQSLEAMLQLSGAARQAVYISIHNIHNKPFC